MTAPTDAMVEALKPCPFCGKADHIDQIWCLLQRAEKAEEFVDGLLGLCQLIAGRDDVTDELRDVLKTNHRVEDARKFRRERHPILTEVRPPISDKLVRAEIMRLMREDFDPTPPNWEGRDWNDNAEDVADRIVALFGAAALQHQEPGGTPQTQQGNNVMLTEDQIKHMVDRFLGWRLPKNFNPDAGISYERPNYHPSVDATLSGTNLFDASQAAGMVRYMIEGLPDPATPPEPSALDRAVEALEPFLLDDKTLDTNDDDNAVWINLPPRGKNRGVSHSIRLTIRHFLAVRKALSAIRGNGGGT